MRILITGAGGMLGQDLVAAGHAAGAECVALAHAELDVVKGTEVEAVVARAAPEVVVNCAAWTDVDGAEAAFEAALAVNRDGAQNLAAAASASGAWMIHVSSDYVFDGTKRTPYVESDQPAPLSAYGRSKLAGEQAVALTAPRNHTIVRSSWLFGVHGRCFPATIVRLGGEREELAVVDDQIGCPTFTGHLAQALIALCRTRAAGILHVAGEGACSWYDLARQIVLLAGLDCTITRSSTAEQRRPASRPAYSVLGSERRGEVRPLPPWQKGLEEYMRAGARA